MTEKNKTMNVPRARQIILGPFIPKNGAHRILFELYNPLRVSSFYVSQPNTGSPTDIRCSF